MRAALQYRKTNAIAMPIKMLAQSVAWSSVLYLVFSGTSPLAQIIGMAFALSCSIAMALIKTLPDARKSQRTGHSPQAILRASLRSEHWRVWLAAFCGVWLRVRSCDLSRIWLARRRSLYVPGTLGLLAAAALAGIFVGGAYAGLRNRLPVGTWRRGLTSGALVVLTLGTLFISNPNMRAEMFRVGRRMLG